MKLLLLKILENKYKEIDIKSIRQIKKILNKFTYLLKTFTEDEKRSLILIINFISYFIYKELYKEIRKTESIFKIDILYFFKDIICGEEIYLFDKESISILNKLATIDEKIEEIGIINQKLLISERFKYVPINQKFEFSQIKILHDGYSIALPLSLNFINEFKEESIYKWCEEKYELTHHIS